MVLLYFIYESIAFFTDSTILIFRLDDSCRVDRIV